MELLAPIQSELWAPSVPGYEVSSCGRIRNSRSGRFLHPSPNDKGYLCVNLRVEKKLKRVRVHRLVASAFCPNPSSMPEVNHKDGRRDNNNYTNLEWCSRSYNLTHSWRYLGRKLPSAAVERIRVAMTGHSNPCSKKIFLNGTPVTAATIARLSGRSKSGVLLLLSKGVSAEKILETPKYAKP